MKKINDKIIFVFLFSLLGLIALKIPVSRIVGSGQSFSFFDFFAPTVAMFLGTLPGAISVLLVKLFDLIFISRKIEAVSLLRLLPLPLAAFYFGSKSKKRSLIAIICIILFIVHPVGRQAWVYSLYWLIPIFACFFPKRLFLKSLGSTFTAHAVGSTIFLYAFQLPTAVWKGLIPVVFVERVGFALGIYLSYFVFNVSLNFLLRVLRFEKLYFLVKKEYLPSWKFLLRYS